MLSCIPGSTNWLRAQTTITTTPICTLISPPVTASMPILMMTRTAMGMITATKAGIITGSVPPMIMVGPGTSGVSPLPPR